MNADRTGRTGKGGVKAGQTSGRLRIDRVIRSAEPRFEVVKRRVAFISPPCKGGGRGGESAIFFPLNWGREG